MTDVGARGGCCGRASRCYCQRMTKRPLGDLRAELARLEAQNQILRERLASLEHGSLLAIDVTVQRRTENELRASKERFEAIAGAMPIPVVITRLSDGRILYCNQPLHEILGVPGDDLVGRTTTEFYSDPRQREHVLELIE